MSRRKVRFRHLLSFFFLLSHNKNLPKDSIPTKALLEFIYAQNNTDFTVVEPLSPFAHELARTAVFLASYDPMAF